MTRRKIFCCVIALCELAGCQLALEGEESGPYEDRLIGMFITTGYIDTPLYASPVTKVLTGENGETFESTDYVFENPGIPFYSPTVPATGEHAGYGTSVSDGAVSGGSVHRCYGDGGNSVTMEGTVYVVPANRDVYYFNPVYQSADGGVYLVSGDGITASGVNDEGSFYSQALDAVYTVTENGVTTEDSFSVKMSVGVILAPESVAILQMDADGTLLSRAEFSPGELPEVFNPVEDTAFFIVETRKRDSSGTVRTSRELYETGADSFGVFYAREDGICVNRRALIEWS